MEFKTEFKIFTVPQYQEEEEYLSNMHAQGWKFVKVSYPGFYKFEKCEPKKVTYRLDYNQEGVKHMDEYVQMFADCGWEYLLDFAGYSYFAKEQEDESEEREEIFCDDESRLDMMRRVIKGKIYPIIIMFFCVVVPQFVINTRGYGTGAHIVQDILSYTCLGLGILYLWIFASMTYQFYKYEKKINQGKTEYAGKYVGITIGLVAIVIAMIGYLVLVNTSDYTIVDTANGFTIETDPLNKQILKEIQLSKGDQLVVKHNYDGGELYISVSKKGEEPIFYGNSYVEFNNFSLDIQEDGLYEIICEGNQARGTIEFTVVK